MTILEVILHDRSPLRPAGARDRLEALHHVIARKVEPTSEAEDIVRVLLDLMDGYDPAIRRHGERTAGYAVAMGEALALPDGELRQLRSAALLHDLGKLLLPPWLLRKPGPLTGDEYALVQSHPRLGAELLEPFAGLRPAAIWIAHHHERWDGCGYPYGVPGPFIPLGARILAVADTFDALTSRGDHGESPPFPAAVRLLQVGAGRQFDPDLVRVFAAPPEPRAFPSFRPAPARAGSSISE